MFRDRHDAGRRLAKALRPRVSERNAIVLALPRGGVPVGYEVARALGADLDVIVVRKLGVPGHAELAMGAIASGGPRVLNPSIVRGLAIPAEVIERVTARERAVLERRERAYRGDRAPSPVEGRTAIVVDDGLATGATMRAAALGLRSRRPGRVVVAVPVGAPSVCADLERFADEVVAVATPPDLLAVGTYYEDFSQVSDDEVRELLDRAWRERGRQVA